MSLHLIFWYIFSGIYWVDRKANFLSFYKYMKLIGWGVEDDVKYWLAVNTWDSWGDNKVYKVPRGINYWYIEFFPTAGVFEDLDWIWHIGWSRRRWNSSRKLVQLSLSAPRFKFTPIGRIWIPNSTFSRFSFW